MITVLHVEDGTLLMAQFYTRFITAKNKMKILKIFLNATLYDC